jgi:hypothetical protein
MEKVKAVIAHVITLGLVAWFICGVVYFLDMLRRAWW